MRTYNSDAIGQSEQQQTSVEVVCEMQLSKKVQISFFCVEFACSPHVGSTPAFFHCPKTFHIIPIKLGIRVCLVERSSPGNECVLSLTHESRRANVKWMKFVTNPISSQAIMCYSELDFSHN